MVSLMKCVLRVVLSALGPILLLCLQAGAAEPLQKGPKPEPLSPPPTATYVGSTICQQCHPAEYSNFKAYSKKARSFQSVLKMVHGLTDSETKKCFECHTTGYGRPGGFVSQAETPHLAEVGCETCHGAAGNHVQSQSRRDIRGKVSTKDCDACHNSERVAAFNFKPMVHSGAH